VKSIQYYDFQLKHRIDLRKYLKKYYSLEFNDHNGIYVCATDPNLSIHRDGKYENTWVRADIITSTKSNFGVYLKYGTVIDWESIKNDCSVVKAVQIVTENKKSLHDYKTVHYKKLESLFTKTATRFRYSRLPEVVDYLKSRGLDHTSYAQAFNIGSPKSYDSLVNDLITTNTTASQIIDLLSDLFIVRRPLNYEYLPFVSSVIVPVYDKMGDFVGYHGRRVSPGIRQRYYNTGFLRDRVRDVLYGENKDEIRESIGKKKQLILTKGIFDFFACYQAGYHQVLSSLNKGISVQQFDRVVKYPVSEIVVGYTSPLERATILGLMHRSLNKIDMSLVEGQKDIDETIKSGATLPNIISDALKKMKATESGKIWAANKRRKSRMETLTELGQTFLIAETDLEALVETSKRSPRKIKDFLIEQDQKGRTSVKSGNFIRFPKTFVTDSALIELGAELRTLLFLLIKTKGRQGPINYTQRALCADLGLSQTVLIDHLNKLKLLDYLIRIKTIRIGQLKKKRKRTVVFHYYPSTIKFG
jgi:hypothetical protein